MMTSKLFICHIWYWQSQRATCDSDVQAGPTNGDPARIKHQTHIYAYIEKCASSQFNQNSFRMADFQTILPRNNAILIVEGFLLLFELKVFYLIMVIEHGGLAQEIKHYTIPLFMWGKYVSGFS